MTTLESDVVTTSENDVGTTLIFDHATTLSQRRCASWVASLKKDFFTGVFSRFAIILGVPCAKTSYSYKIDSLLVGSKIFIAIALYNWSVFLVFRRERIS